MPMWNVWGRVVGPSLPREVINIGDVRIGPIQAETYPSRLPKRPMDLSGYPTHIRVNRPEVDIGSDCWLVVGGVEADDPDAALYKVRRDVAPLVIAALSARVASEAYHVELLGVEGAERGQGNYEYSAVESFIYFEPEELPRDEAAAALGRWRRLYEQDGPLRTAAHALARGVRAAETSSGIEGTAASLLAYFQVIEACASVAPWEPPSELEEQQQAVLDMLDGALSSERPTRRLVSGVHSASDALKRLTNTFLDLRIQHAASTFGLDAEWLEGARALKKTRDQELGHSKGGPNERELEEWSHSDGSVRSAYSLAMPILRAATLYELEPRT